MATYVDHAKPETYRKNLMSERAASGSQAYVRVALAITAIIAACIAVLTLAPITTPQVIGSGSDKVYHLIAFASLTFPSALLAQRISGRVFILALFFAAAIEIIQPSVGRSGDWGDFLADAAGALIGFGAGLVCRRFFSS